MQIRDASGRPFEALTDDDHTTGQVAMVAGLDGALVPLTAAMLGGARGLYGYRVLSGKGAALGVGVEAGGYASVTNATDTAVLLERETRTSRGEALGGVLLAPGQRLDAPFTSVTCDGSPLLAELRAPAPGPHCDLDVQWEDRVEEAVLVTPDPAGVLLGDWTHWQVYASETPFGAMDLRRGNVEASVLAGDGNPVALPVPKRGAVRYYLAVAYRDASGVVALDAFGLPMRAPVAVSALVLFPEPEDA